MTDPIDNKSASPTALHPDVKALLICDQAIREEGTGKVSLIGIFERIMALQVPARHPNLSVYAQITDAQGHYELSLELVRLEDLVVIGRGKAAVDIPDRLLPTEIVFSLQFLSFDRLGQYEFRLSANGRHLAGKTFSVIKLDRPSADAPEGEVDG